LVLVWVLVLVVVLVLVKRGTRRGHVLSGLVLLGHVLYCLFL
jgi:hypothetical protein